MKTKVENHDIEIEDITLTGDGDISRPRAIEAITLSTDPNVVEVCPVMEQGRQARIQRASRLSNPYQVERYHADRDQQIENNALWFAGYDRQVEREGGV